MRILCSPISWLFLKLTITWWEADLQSLRWNTNISLSQPLRINDFHGRLLSSPASSHNMHLLIHTWRGSPKTSVSRQLFCSLIHFHDWSHDSKIPVIIALRVVSIDVDDYLVYRWSPTSCYTTWRLPRYSSVCANFPFLSISMSIPLSDHAILCSYLCLQTNPGISSFKCTDVPKHARATELAKTIDFHFHEWRSWQHLPYITYSILSNPFIQNSISRYRLLARR